MNDITSDPNLMFDMLSKGKNFLVKNKVAGSGAKSDKPNTITVMLDSAEKPKLNTDSKPFKIPKQQNIDLEEDKVEEPEDQQESQSSKHKAKPEVKASEPSKPEAPKKGRPSEADDPAECDYCTVRIPTRNTKFENEVKHLVTETISTEMPAVISETIKHNIAVNIVKQTKAELAGIHDSNYQRIEKSVLEYANTKISESKKVIQDKTKSKIDQMITNEVNRVFQSVVLPKCEGLISEMMEGLFDTVKQTLKQNNEKTRMLEQKVQKFVDSTQKYLSDQKSEIQAQRQPQSTGDSDLNSIFSDDGDKSPGLDTDMGKSMQTETNFMTAPGPKMGDFPKGKT